jgi:hypothetical protein
MEQYERVRAKVKLVGVKPAEGNYGDKEPPVTLEFYFVYSSDPNSENKKFWDYTPGGKIEMNLVKPETRKMFDMGKEYYIDFSPAPETTG